MTLLCCTVTPTTAWLTTDSGAFELDPGGMPEAATSEGTATPPQGRQEGDPARLVCLGAKLLVMPQGRVALAGAGHRLALLAVAGEVALAGHGFDALVPGLPSYLNGMVRELPEDRRNLLLMVFGFSDREQRALGFAYASGEGFAPRALTGHCWMPNPDPEAPGYDRLRLLARTAEAGQLVPELHLEVARNVAWSTAAGHQRPGFGVAGPIACAKVDRHGASRFQIGDLGLPGEVRAA